MNTIKFKKFVKKNLKYVTINFGSILKFFHFGTRKDSIIINHKKKAIFFGYYDISPFNITNDKVLLNLYDGKQTQTPRKDDYIDVGYYDLKKEELRIINKTNTWCWQQGCRLQFYPNNSNEQVIFNKLVQENYGAIIYNISLGETVKTINYPIYSIDSKGKYGLSLNFSRLQRLRPGYGYNTLPDNTFNSQIPPNEGVWLIDLEKNNSELIIQLQDLANIAPEHSMKNTHHYINHILFSPDDKKFMFFHLWGNGKERFSRTFIYTFKSNELRLLDPDSLASSHYTFKNKDELLLTVIDKKLGLTYKLYNLNDGSIKLIKNPYLLNDSHPTFINNNKLIFDSYPDIFGFSKLKILDFNNNICIPLDKNYHPGKFKAEFRCDLHPRINFEKTAICIDTIKNSKRIMKIINL